MASRKYKEAMDVGAAFNEQLSLVMEMAASEVQALYPTAELEGDSSIEFSLRQSDKTWLASDLENLTDSLNGWASAIGAEVSLTTEGSVLKVNLYLPGAVKENLGSRHSCLERNGQDPSVGQKDAALFNQTVKQLKSAKGLEGLTTALNGMSQQQRDLLELGFGQGKLAYDMNVTNEAIAAKDLHPTQKEIDVGKSLSYPLAGKNPQQIKDILAGGPVTINLPLVVYNYKGTYYIVDGHHRWSQVYLLNPDCKINCIVFENSAGDREQDPIDMLRDFQGAIAIASNGKVPSATAQGGMNIFEWPQSRLKQYIMDNLSAESLAAFQAALGDKVDKGSICSAIMKTAAQMQADNKPIAGAPSRAVMPQTDVASNAGLKKAIAGMADI